MITTSRDEFARAVDLHRAGDLGVAGRIYESVLARVPTHADALHLLGVVRHQQGNHDQAADLIGKALALAPNVAVYHASMAEVHRARGQLEAAVARGREAIQRGLDDPATRNNLGLALHLLGRHAEAVGAFLAVLDSEPNNPMAHTNLGAALRELGEKDQALMHMTRAAELAPQLASARNNLGQFLVDLGRPDDALPHCQAAIALEPAMAEAHNNLGNVYRAIGHLPEARWCYTTALRHNPAMSQACASLALTYQLEGRWDEAMPWLRRATEIQPQNREYLQFRAEAACDRELFGEAISAYNEIISRYPEDANAHNTLCWLLQEVGQLDLAERHVLTALTLKPDLASARLNMGDLCKVRGDFAAAEAHFRAALDDASSRGLALARLAMLLRARLSDQDLEAMQQQLAVTVASDPARINLLFGLAQVWDARHRFADAAECAREANALAVARLQKRRNGP